MQKLLIATRNPGKVAEFADIMNDLKVDWLSLADLGITQEVAETGSTFTENAILKARAYAAAAGVLTLADDSGLEVDALGGAPGVQTARFGGPGLSHEARFRLLLARMADVPEEQRTARFRCVIALATGAGEVLATAEGVCEGHIAKEPAGSYGFGYDPIFVVAEKGVTMAQLPPEIKHPLSHRGRAIQALAPQLKQWLGHSN